MKTTKKTCEMSDDKHTFDLDGTYPSCYGLTIRWKPGNDENWKSKRTTFHAVISGKGFDLKDVVSVDTDCTEHNSMTVYITSWYQYTFGPWIDWSIYEAANNILDTELEFIKC